MTLRDSVGPQGRSGARWTAAAVALSALALGACNESFIPNYNNPTTFSATQAGLTNAVFGVYNPRADQGNWAIWSSGMSREATYFTSSEQRFVTELTGKASIQPDDFIGGTVWDAEFGNIKTADTTLALLPQVTIEGLSLTPGQVEAMYGVIETGKVYNYMLTLESRDTLGVPMNAVGESSAPFAPILCADLAWGEIVAMLDSAVDSLTVAGATPIPINLPGGFSQNVTLNDNAADFMAVTLALRGKARVEYAYAIARQAGGATTGTLGGAAVPQLDSAEADLQASPVLYVPLSLTDAVPGNDPGAYFVYSPSSGDLLNPVFQDIKGYYGLKLYVDGLHGDTLDARWASKFVNLGAVPTAPSAAGVASSWNYSNNLSGSSSLPIIRGVEMHYLVARAEFGLGHVAGAKDSIDLIRENVGGLGVGTVGPSPAAVAAYIVQQAQISFIAEGTGEDVAAIRDYGLQSTFQTNYAPNDLETTVLPIPVTETDPRGGNVTPVCTGAASQTTPKPAAKAVKPAATPLSKHFGTIKLH